MVKMLYLEKVGGSSINEVTKKTPFLQASQVFVLRSSSIYPFLFQAFQKETFDVTQWLEKKAYREETLDAAANKAQDWSTNKSECDVDSIDLPFMDEQGAIAHSHDSDAAEEGSVESEESKDQTVTEDQEETQSKSSDGSDDQKIQQPLSESIGLFNKSVQIKYVESIDLLKSTHEAQEKEGAPSVDVKDVPPGQIYIGFKYRVLDLLYATLEKDYPPTLPYLQILRDRIAELAGQLQDGVLDKFVWGKKSKNMIFEAEIILQEAKYNYVKRGFTKYGDPDLFSENPFVARLTQDHVAAIIDDFALMATHIMLGGFQQYYTQGPCDSISFLSSRAYPLVHKAFCDSAPHMIYMNIEATGSHLPEKLSKDFNMISSFLNSKLKLSMFDKARFDPQLRDVLVNDPQSYIACAGALDLTIDVVQIVVHYFSEKAISLNSEEFVKYVQTFKRIFDFVVDSKSDSMLELKVFDIFRHFIESNLSKLTNISKQCLRATSMPISLSRLSL